MKRKGVVSLVIALALVFSCMPAYAASTPAKVTGLKQTSASEGTVTVSWNKAKNAKQYQVYVSSNGKSGKYKKVATVSAKKYTIKGYGANKTLWAKVRAVNGKKTGKFSSIVKAVTGKQKQLVYAPAGTCEKYRQQMMKLKEQTNFVYSPVSLNTAMQMYLAYEPDNATAKELVANKDYLGYKYGSKTYKSVNRIWVNKDRNVVTPASVKKYEYKLSMKDSKKATDEKNKFVSDNTNGFIDGTPTILNSSVEYDIMNILYFKDAWKNGDLRKDSETTKFNNKKNVKMMNASSDYYYENNTAYMIPIEYENGNRMLLIYPKTDINSVDLSNIESSKVKNTAKVKFPPFSSKLSFTANKAYPGMPAMIMQTVRIVVNEKGTEVAAVTEALKCTSAPTQTKPLSLTFNKTFLYAIEDTTNGDIAFMGIVDTL